MPEDLNQPVAPSPEPAAQPVAAPEPTPRQAIADKYQSLYEPATPAPDPVAPVADPAPTVAPPPAEPVVDPKLAALEAEIAELRAKLAPPPPTPAAPTVAEPEDWLKLLAEGKKDEAEAALRAKLAVPDQQAVIAAAVEQMQAQNEAQRFVSEIRTANADLLPFENYISTAVNAELSALASAKPDMRPMEWTEAYKAAVTKHITQTRNLILQFRGEGALQATTRTTQVAASPTLQPSPVNTNRETSQAPVAPEQPSDYIAARQARQAAAKGLVSA